MVYSFCLRFNVLNLICRYCNSFYQALKHPSLLATIWAGYISVEVSVWKLPAFYKRICLQLSWASLCIAHTLGVGCGSETLLDGVHGLQKINNCKRESVQTSIEQNAVQEKKHASGPYTACAVFDFDPKLSQGHQRHLCHHLTSS